MASGMGDRTLGTLVLGSLVGTWGIGPVEAGQRRDHPAAGCRRSSGGSDLGALPLPSFSR